MTGAFFEAFATVALFVSSVVVFRIVQVLVTQAINNRSTK